MSNETVLLLPSDEKQSRASKKPRRVGADFHQRLKSSGQLDVDDEDWCVSVFSSFCFSLLAVLFPGYLHLIVCGILFQDHIQSKLIPSLLVVAFLQESWMFSKCFLLTACVSCQNNYAPVGGASKAYGNHRVCVCATLFRRFLDEW